MDSLDRFWYYSRDTLGPHCCISTFRRTENSYQGLDIWRKVRGENRQHCPSIHAQPRPMERLVNTRHWRGKTDTSPIEELPFFKVRSLNLHLQRFFCRSLVDEITFFLLRCPASPCLSLLLPCPAPQILSREKSAAPSIPAMWGPHVMNLWCWEWVGG